MPRSWLEGTHTQNAPFKCPPPVGPLEIVECEIPELDPCFVRIKVQACRICDSDSLGMGETITQR